MTEEGQNSAEDKRLRRDPRDEVWEHWQGAVLLKNEIEYYCSLEPPLIEDFDLGCLEPASYHLRLGEECRVSGENRNLSDENPKLVIPPHELAVVSTLEKLSIPGFLIARWNLRVTEVYEGLLWVGGPQVDPGYEGHLYCPLYNLSTRQVELRFKDPLFTVDFVRTTRFGEGCTMWKRTRPDSLGAHDIHRLQSATSEDLKRVDELASEVRAAQRNILPVLAILIAAVAVIASLGIFGLYEIPSANKYIGISIGLSGIAFILALLALFKSRIKKK
jgi:deoxycytidine triphosphate deaminase